MKLLPHPQNPADHKLLDSMNWITCELNDSIISSYRDDYLDRVSFPSSLHFHDYYEVVVVLNGEIRYVCENARVKPQRCDVVVIPPGKFHMSIIDADETQYVRHVFYFYPDAFSAYQCDNLMDFLKNIDGENFCLSFSSDNREKLLRLIAELKKNAQLGKNSNNALILANILQIFALFNHSEKISLRTDEYLPSSLLEIQNYIDNHFVEIDTMADISEQLHYTREHMSRLFKKHMKTTVAEYILQRRITYSCQLMSSSMPLSEICFRSGFGSMPAFIRGFKQIMGTTPSLYRKSLSVVNTLVPPANTP